MASSKFDICSNALTMVGAATISSFTEGSAESNTAGQHYERVVTARLGAQPWGFATELLSLGSKESSTPVGTWDYSWQIPGSPTLLTFWGVYRADLPVDYERFGPHIFTNENADLYAKYTFRQDEQYWDALFVDALVIDLAALFALTLVRNVDLYNAFTKPQGRHMSMLDEAWAIARNRNATGQTSRRLVGDRLTGSARFGGTPVEGETAS